MIWAAPTIVWIMISHIVFSCVGGFGGHSRGERYDVITNTDTQSSVYSSKKECDDVRKQYDFKTENVTCDPRVLSVGEKP